MVDAVVSARIDSRFPWGTLLINVSGAFVLGVLVGASLHGDALLLGGAATVGSYTTVSTWLLETHRLGEQGQRLAMAVNIAASVALGVAAAALGRALGGTL